MMMKKMATIAPRVRIMLMKIETGRFNFFAIGESPFRKKSQSQPRSIGRKRRFITKAKDAPRISGEKTPIIHLIAEMTIA
ncbi:MAG: hypothetical protein IJO89_02185, partial [Clostridia bacterium]|nr:hypothetical protein [Clostridia bacterium]